MIVISSAAPEFNFERPLGSVMEILRAVFLSPKRFFLGFSPASPLKNAIAFVVFVTAVTAVIRLAMTLIFASNDLRSASASVAEAAAFIVLAPLLVAVGAAVYLLAIRAFVGKVGNLGEVYRILAYSYAPMILFWVPALNAFVFTYGALILVALAIKSIYRTSTMTALITALVGFVPVAVGFIYLQIAVTGFAFR